MNYWNKETKFNESESKENEKQKDKARIIRDLSHKLKDIEFQMLELGFEEPEKLIDPIINLITNFYKSEIKKRKN